jgi:hypothetical protein
MAVADAVDCVAQVRASATHCHGELVTNVLRRDHVQIRAWVAWLQCSGHRVVWTSGLAEHEFGYTTRGWAGRPEHTGRKLGLILQSTRPDDPAEK